MKTRELSTSRLRALARNVRLVALDMDGTTMNDHREVTPRTLAAIHELMKRGILVVPCTGRSLNNLREKVPQLASLPYVISENGALVTDNNIGNTIFESLIPTETAAEMVVTFPDVPESCLTLYARDIRRVASLDETIYRKSYWHHDGDHLEEVYSPERLRRWLLSSNERPRKMVLWFKREDGFAHYETLAQMRFPQINCFRVSQYSLEFTNGSASKGAALSVLCEYLHIPVEQTCAFGDNGNDVGMLSLAGIGVAMENAIGPVKDIADYVAGHNNEEGVAGFLEQYFLWEGTNHEV